MNYNQLLEALDSIFADYGNRSLSFPSDELKKKYYNDELTESEAKEIFALNDGNEQGCIEYLEEED